MEPSNRLQEIRRKEIPETIAKYKTLIDGIFTEVAKPFPTFKDINLKDDDGDVIKAITAEEQLYSFMLMREKAIDHADRMLNKINELELELNAPDLFQALKKEKVETTTLKEEPPKRRNIAKEKAEANKQ